MAQVLTIKGQRGPQGEPGSSFVGGRLTLASGNTVLTTSVSNASTVYFTPCFSNAIFESDGAVIKSTKFNECSQSLTDSTKSPAVAVANSAYDMFFWNDGGTQRCTRGPSWSSLTSRGAGVGTTELIRLEGVLVNRYAITNGPAAGVGIYVGSIYTNATAKVDFIFGSAAAGGGAASFGVWNYYNRFDVKTMVSDSNVSWSYNTAAWRAADGGVGNRITFLCGLRADAVAARYQCSQTSSTGAIYIGVGLDSTTIPLMKASQNGNAYQNSMNIEINVSDLLGQHYFQGLEYGSGGTNTWYGNGFQGLLADLRL
jgi:hypothetical protein